MGKGQDNNTQPNQSKKLSKAWPDFAAKLVAVLAELQEDEILILAKKNSEQDVIQFIGQGSWGIRLEVVSNFFRDDQNKLTNDQIATLLSLGWNSPTGSDRESTPELDPDGSPNYFGDVQVPLDRQSISHLAIVTLVEVFGIGHPSRLEYESFDGEGNSLAQPALGLKPRIDSDFNDYLRDNLLPIVRELTGIPDLNCDDDGDISGIQYQNISVYLRLLDDGPYVRCLAMLLVGVEETLPLLARINELNLQNGHLHLYVRNGEVGAVSDVLVVPLVTSHLAHALGNFCQCADEMYEVLHQEFGKEACQFNQSTSVRH